MRIYEPPLIGLVLMLAACSPGDGGGATNATAFDGQEDVAGAAVPAVIPCRTAEQEGLSSECRAQWRGVDKAGRHILVLAHPGGGFRRLLVAADGTLGQADGSEPLRLVSRDGDKVRLAIAGDQYELTHAQLKPPVP